MNKTLKTVIIIIVIIVIAAVLFYFLGGQSSGTVSSALVGQSAIETSSVGSQELALLNQVKTINIDTKFFTDKIFVSLVDLTQPIPTVNVGRPNPFAPVGGVPSPFSAGGTAR